jgi:stage II sporulation protein D
VPVVSRSVPSSPRSRALALGLAAAATLTAAAPAAAETRFVIRGAGFGHGVGMSQYGALGQAKAGRDYRQILTHYYTGTQIARLDGASETRVLLQGASRVRFSGARQVAGGRRLTPGTTYSVTRASAARVRLVSPTGRTLGTYAAPLRVAAADGGILLAGRAGNGITGGRYRGALELRPGPGGVSAVNAVGLEEYVRGVVAAESPSSWPAEALRAQAVAARSYALTTSKNGAGFDHYPDTRSQVYNGVRGETATTDAATAATAGEVVTHGGKPVVTYFFSTSGGKTEDVENSFIGATPQPWLKSVDDPWDKGSPRHRWGPYRMSLATAERRLGSWVKGRFRGIEVQRRGSSPRVVSAEVVGTRGRTRVTGPQLRTRLRLFDHWMTFTTIGANASRPEPTEAPEPEPTGASAGAASGSGGAMPRAMLAATRAARTGERPRRSQGRRTTVVPKGIISGRVWPERDGAKVAVQRRTKGEWTTAIETTTDAQGRYRAVVGRTGSYRVQYRREQGATIRVR